MYYNKSLKKYLDDLAARLPAPGGGSAAALVACSATALISMVINFTIGKPKYAMYKTDLRKMLSKSEGMRKQLLNLVDLDVLAFKSKDIKKAISVPRQICKLCFEAMQLCYPLIKKGNINLISDVGVAAVLLEAGFSSALFNIKINLKYLRDNSLKKKINKELANKNNSIKTIRKNLEARIYEIIRG